MFLGRQGQHMSNIMQINSVQTNNIKSTVFDLHRALHSMHTLTCRRQCRNLPWWFRAWTQLGWSHPASPCLSSPHPCLPTPEDTTEGWQMKPATVRTFPVILWMFLQQQIYSGCHFPQQSGSRSGFRLLTCFQVQHTVLYNLLCGDSYHGNQWSRAHVLDEGRKEWFVLQVNVVLPQEVLGGLQQETDITAQFYCTLYSTCLRYPNVSTAVSRVQTTSVAHIRKRHFHLSKYKCSISTQSFQVWDSFFNVEIF